MWKKISKVKQTNQQTNNQTNKTDICQGKDLTNQTQLPWQNEHCSTYIILYRAMIRQDSLLIWLRSSLKKLKIVIDCDKTSMVSAHCCHHFKHFIQRCGGKVVFQNYQFKFELFAQKYLQWRQNNLIDNLHFIYI